MHDRGMGHRGLLHIRCSVFAACPAFIGFPVVVNHFETGRDELYLSTDKLLTDFYHGAPAPFTDLFTFIDRMKHFAAGKVFDQFFPLARVLPFTQMLFDFDQVRLMGTRIGTGFCFIKKRHLSLHFKGRCLLRLCSIKFTGKEINLLFQEPDLLFQFFDLFFVLLFCVWHGMKTFLF